MRLDRDSTSLFKILLLLVYPAFFLTTHLPLNDIVALGTLLSLNFSKHLHSVQLSPFNASNVN